MKQGYTMTALAVRVRQPGHREDVLPQHLRARRAGIILTSDGKLADHTSIQDTADGGNPGGFFGYATAWLEYQLRGDATAAGAFTGPHPELLSNINWPGSAIK
jgi:hypothetical protein